MLIKYIGHSCFKIRDDESGYSIILDPYKNGSVNGYHDIVDSASEVLCSHQHDDHYGVECIRIEPKEESPYEVTWIDTFHDDQKGALRGSDRIHIITHRKTGEKLVHYGDVGEVLDDLLTDDNLTMLRDADIALVPCGGAYTYDRYRALELIRRTNPKLAIPMHFRSERLGFDFPHFDTIEMFLDAAAESGLAVNVSQLCFVDNTQIDLKCDILALRPQNI